MPRARGVLALLACLPLLLLATPAITADTLRLALWNIGLERKGPGLLLRDLDRGDDPAITAALAVIARLDADILVLAGVDHDPGLQALSALEALLQAAGQPYPHLYAPRPNSGQPSGRDLDGDGRLNEAEDALGWGPFPGAGGLAILSRLPLLADEAQDYSAFPWRDLPGANLPPGDAASPLGDLPLSSRSHAALPVQLPGGGRLTLLIWHATPPVFDGPEDRNGRRNADEAAFWLHLIDGRLPYPAPTPPFILMGDANLDPLDGDGRAGAISALLAHPGLQDPAPRGSHGRSEPGHRGDPALDTVLYPQLGGLRLEYILPSRDIDLRAAGVFWPDRTDPLHASLTTASRHFPVWIDISVPPAGPPPTTASPSPP